MECRDGIKSKGDKIMMACTHNTDARNSQPKRINDTSPILSQRHTESDVYVHDIHMPCVEVSVSEWNGFNCSYQVCSI